MKCKNCSWPNRPGEKNCIKCGAPLNPETVAAQTALSSHNPTVVNDSVPGQPAHQQVLRPSGPVMPPPQVAQPQMRPVPVAPANPNVCPRCDYPLRPGMEECPNCRYRVVPAPQPPREAVPQRPAQAPASPQVAAPQPGRVAPHRPTTVGFPDAPKAPAAPPAGTPAPGSSPSAAVAPDAPAYRGTVNVYTAAATDTTPKFSLTPVQKVNEPEAPASLSFQGQEAILNRANTDPENLSITSRQQASISRRDGKWVISDLSDQQTTFIHPANGHELRDGDMILLGNRLFIFHG